MVIPALISVAIGLLSWMALNVNRISEALAVLVFRTETHERRLEVLEKLRTARHKS